MISTKLFLLYFNDKIHIWNNGYDSLALGYQNEIKKSVILVAVRNSILSSYKSIP